MPRHKGKLPLSDDQVSFIREAGNVLSQTTLGHMFGVTNSWVSHVQNRDTRVAVPDHYVMNGAPDSWYVQTTGNVSLIMHPNCDTIQVLRGSPADSKAYAEIIVWLLNHTACEPQ